LAPEQTPERQQWVKELAEATERSPKEHWRRFWLGNAHLRAGEFQQAEANVRAAIKSNDALYQWPILATILHYLGRSDDARATLRNAEDRYAKLVAEAHTADPPWIPQYWEEELIYQATVREARTLILGPASAISADVRAVLARNQERLAAIERMDDDFARQVRLHPSQPRCLIDQGRRLGEQGRWADAAQAFARAAALAPKEGQVWKELGRAHAELRRWDEAASALVRALEAFPQPAANFPYYPWEFGRGDVDELIAGSDELFDRVAKQRPKDQAVSARRAEFLVGAGRWALAEAALRDHIGRFPDDWWAPTLLAKLLLHSGKVDEHRQVCRQALDHFNGTSVYYLPLNIGRAALLANGGFEADPLIRKIVADADLQKVPEFWMQATAALVELRQGNPAAALKRLNSRVTPIPDYAN